MGTEGNRANETKSKGRKRAGDLTLLEELTQHCRDNFILEVKFGDIELKFHARSFPEKQPFIDLREEKDDNKKKPIGAFKSNDDVLFHSV